MACKIDRQYNQILVEVEGDSNIEAFVLCGSRGKGLENESSDYDCALFVKDEVIEKYRKKYSNESPELELWCTTLREFKDHAEIGTEFEWDRYNWAHLTPVVDKTNGALQKLIDAKALIPSDRIKSFVEGVLDEYVNCTYRSIKCLRDGDQLGLHLEAAGSIRPMLDCLFVLDDGRVRPYPKYLEWELERRPLTQVPWGTKEFVRMVEKILRTGDRQAQQTILSDIRSQSYTLGYGSVFDGWDGKDLWAINFKK